MYCFCSCFHHISYLSRFETFIHVMLCTIGFDLYQKVPLDHRDHLHSDEIVLHSLWYRVLTTWSHCLRHGSFVLRNSRSYNAIEVTMCGAINSYYAVRAGIEVFISEYLHSLCNATHAYLTMFDNPQDFAWQEGAQLEGGIGGGQEGKSKLSPRTEWGTVQGI